MSELTDRIYREYKQRILSGMSIPQTTAEVRAIVEADDETMAQLWEERADWILSNIFSQGTRVERNQLLNKVASAVPVNSGVFGERRIDVSVLQRPESIFDSLLHVGDRWLRYGDMRREDWHTKAREYYVSADRAMERAFAAENIMEHVSEDQTTEQSLTEDEFVALLPADGF